MAWAMTAAALAAGCSATPAPAPQPARLSVQATGYEEAFDAVKDELRAVGFTLARVDARHGVITTEPLVSAGLATPWVRAESTLEQEAAGYLHRNRRRAEATFTSEDDADDLRLAEGAVSVRIRVYEDRVYRFGVQPHPTTVRLTSVSSDPSLAAVGAEPLFAEQVGEDDRLARRIADRLRERLEGAGAQISAGAEEHVNPTEGV